MLDGWTLEQKLVIGILLGGLLLYWWLGRTEGE